MSEPTQQDRERAADFAGGWLHGDPLLPKVRPDLANALRVLLALLAEREAAPSVSRNRNFASGRRAGLLELAEWLETSRGGLDPLPEPRAYYEGQRDVLGNVASRARAMADRTEG